MSTLKEKIAVMQAAEDGAEIQQQRGDGERIHCCQPKLLTWAWGEYEYHIKPQPKEIWVNEYKTFNTNYLSEEAAKAGSSFPERVAVLYREVTE